MKIAVLIAAHNRRYTTLRALRSLTEQWPQAHQLQVVLVDDGSTDGTSDAVRNEFPGVRIVAADGDLFWCKAMALAWETAAELGGFDAVMWLNDDVVLDTSAIDQLLPVVIERSGPERPAIVVGATRHPDGGATTYGGLRLTSSWHPGKHELVDPNGMLQAIDTFHGNVVVVPAPVEARIGRISNRFVHGTGDTEYGLRARRAGIDIVLLADHVGTCPSHPAVSHTLRTYLAPKGLPWRDWLYVTRRYTRYGLWPIAFARPYLRVTINTLATAATSRRRTRTSPS